MNNFKIGNLYHTASKNKLSNQAADDKQDKERIQSVKQTQYNPFV